MKYRICILAILAVMTMATANADNWKSMNFRKDNSTNSWNYHGTELRGVTHGGGFANRQTQERRSWSSGTDAWTRNGGIGDVRQDARRNHKALNGSSSHMASATGSRVRLVSGNPRADRQRHTGGGYGGTQTVKEYRYAPQKGNEGVALSPVSNVRMNVPSTKSTSVADAEEKRVEDTSGPMNIGRRDGTAGGPSGKSGAGGNPDAPLGDGVLPLALLALALLAWKKMK